MKRRIFSAIMAATFVMATVTSCSSTGDTTTDSGTETTTEATNTEEDTTADTTADTTEKIEINVWYPHTGPEAEVQENAIAKYNTAQDKYEAIGLSASDKQKIIVALTGSDAPDVIIGSNQDVISYASSGLLESVTALDEADDSFSLEETFSPQSITANTVDGTIYAVPHSSMVIQMFYNKDILAEIGYDAPPETMEELYEMAIKATEVDADGNITRVGYPLFPLASARQELIYAFGGKWWAEDGTLTPDDPKIIDSLNMNVAYRDMYGIDKVQQFTATANTNRYTENDMFFAGKQLFRFDGPWMAQMVENFNPDVNYGVALIPGTGDASTMGTSRYETNGAFIPVVSEQKEGAWDFAKTYATGDIIKEVLIGLGNLPCQPALYEDADILAIPDYPMFIEALKAENGIQYPDIKDLAKYTSLIEEHLDYVYNGMMSPEEAMAALKVQSDTLN